MVIIDYMGIIPYNKNAMNSKAIKLYLKEKTKFELTFQDGTKRRYDALDLFEFDPNVFTLIDNNIFKKAKLTEDNKIVWPGKIKINVKGDHAPENYVFTAFGRFVDMEPLPEEE